MAVYEGAGQRRHADAAAAQRIAELRLQALELPHKTFSGVSSARQMAAGSRFALSQHDHYPAWGDAGEANAFKLLAVEHLGANNLPAQVAQVVQRLRRPGQAALRAQSPPGPGHTSTSSYQQDSNRAGVDALTNLANLPPGS